MLRHLIQQQELLLKIRAKLLSSGTLRKAQVDDMSDELVLSVYRAEEFLKAGWKDPLK